MSNDELIGYHKGALATLVKEREEMKKILSIVEQLMHAHIDELKKLGVDLEKQSKSQDNNSPSNNTDSLDEKI